MTGMQMFLSFLMICICGFLVLVILIQRGRGSGLAGAFGGGGGSAAFGAKTGDVLTWITVAIAVVFLCLAVALNFALDTSAPKLTAESALTIDPISVDDTTTTPVTGAGESAPVDASGLLTDTPPVGNAGDTSKTTAPAELPAGAAASPDGKPVDGSAGGSEPVDPAGSGSPDKPSP